MKYILYFASYDNDTYFYNSLKELLNDWYCETLEQFKEEHKRQCFRILKIENIIIENKGDQ